MFDNTSYRIRQLAAWLIVSKHGNRAERYGIPFLALSLLFIGPYFSTDLFSHGSILILSLLVIILSAWRSGYRSGIFATSYASVLSLVLFGPVYELTNHPSHLMRVVFFFTEGLLISILSAARRDAEKQKDEFIALLSHELKNPLTVIKSYSGLLKKHAISSENERQVQYISKVEVHTNKIVELINDLLDVSKITSGKLIFSDEYFSLFQLVVDTVRDQRLVSKTHAILLKGTSKKVIWGDRYRIGQIITNLITNAIKYSPTKDKVVVIIKDNKHGTRIEIKDYGMGIGEHDQDLIFDRFYRGRAEKTKIQGLGMGLYISSQIAKRHKGKLWLKSKPGKGSSFFLQLPTLSDRHKILKQQLRKSS